MDTEWVCLTPPHSSDQQYTGRGQDWPLSDRWDNSTQLDNFLITEKKFIQDFNAGSHKKINFIISHKMCECVNFQNKNYILAVSTTQSTVTNL